VVAKLVTPRTCITSIVQQVRALYKLVRAVKSLGIVILLSAFIKHKTFLDVLHPVLHSPFFSSGPCPLSCLTWKAYGTNTMTIISCSLLHFKANAHYSRTRDALRLLAALLCRRFSLSVLNNSVDRHLQRFFYFNSENSVSAGLEGSTGMK
jgi:hypothetical protein